LKIDRPRYMLRGVWQALNCLSIDATFFVIVAGASPGETKMWDAVRENGDFLHLRGSNTGNWETVIDRWVHAARRFYRATLCKRGLCCHAVSVLPSVTSTNVTDRRTDRQSVCLSVRLSRSWIMSKRTNISWIFFIIG